MTRSPNPFKPALAALLILGGCVTRVTPPAPPPGPFPGAADVALGSSADPVREGEASATSPDVYKLTLPAELANTNGLLYAEVASAAGAPADALSLTLYDEVGEALLRSSRPDFFGAAETPTPTPAPARVSARAITARPICRGPCVLLGTPPTPGQADVVYLEVTAAQSAAYALYLFTENPADTGENANDDRNTAVSVEGAEAGALETVGDEDFYRSGTSVTRVSLASGATALALRAEIYGENGALLASVPAGTPYASALAPERFLVRVYSDAGRAAAAGSSSYTLTFE